MSRQAVNHPALAVQGLPQRGLAKTPIFAPVSALLIVSLAFSACGTKPASESVRASALDRIQKTRTLRCSYLIYSPYFRKDPNTGKLSGIFHDLMEQLGKNAGLKIDWVEQVGYENIFPGLNTDRYDVFAGGLWPNSTRAQAAFFTIPVFYSVIKAWGRPDDKRFVNNLSAINSPSVRIAMIDGAMEDIIAKTDFPEAKRVSLPELSPFTQNLLNITSGKADVTFAEPSIVAEFLATNPGKLKEIAPEHPLRIFGNSLVIKLGDLQLQEFLDVALRELLYSGAVDKILRMYEPVPNAFPRVAKPYELAPER
jgi:polar amino acid transport system substrate-binding protein